MLLWEIASYGKAPLQEHSIDQVIQLAESNILSQCHLSTKLVYLPTHLPHVILVLPVNQFQYTYSVPFNSHLFVTKRKEVKVSPKNDATLSCIPVHYDMCV